MALSKGKNCSILINSIKCDGCGKCIEICEENAISIEDPSFVDREKCTCCGKCVEICETKALEMERKGLVQKMT